jgi:hypothetical protein
MKTARLAVGSLVAAIACSAACTKSNPALQNDSSCQAYLSCLTALASSSGAAQATYQSQLVVAQALYGPTGTCGSTTQTESACAQSCVQALGVVAAAYPNVAECGGAESGFDMGGSPRDLSASSLDFSMSHLDFSTSHVDFSHPHADFSASPSCTQIAAWPAATGDIAAFFTPNDDSAGVDDSTMQAVDPTANAAGNYNILLVEVDVSQGAPPAYPQTATFTSATTFDTPPIIGSATSTALVYLYANYDVTSTTGGTGYELYLAQSGSATLTRVDDTATGTMTTSGTNLHLVQWPTDSTAPDAPLANGKCYDIASFSLSAVYTPPTDAGT